MSNLVAKLRVCGTSLYDQAADRIERLEAELAEAILKKKDAIIRWSRLYEEHGDVYRELAAANAKIARVKEACEDTYCYDADDTHDPLDRCVNEVIGDIRAALADPAPQESHAGSLAGSTIQAKDDQC